MDTNTKKEKINFSLNNLFYTPKTEKEFLMFLDRYNGNEKALVALASTISVNYILNKINNDFIVYKK